MKKNKYLTIEILLFTVLICLVFMMALFSTFGCASISTPEDVKRLAVETFRKDMKVVVDGVEYRGTGVLPIRPAYKIQITPKEKASRLILQNCHREIVIDKPKTGWFSKTYQIDFAPIDVAESGKLCQLEIASTNEQVKNSFAFFEFDDSRPEVSLQALLKCNGQQSFSRAGVSLCQSAEGLEQVISFSQKVVNEGNIEECNQPESKDGFTWVFIPNKNKCSYYFVAQKKHPNGKRLAHRLTSIGYSMIPVDID